MTRGRRGQDDDLGLYELISSFGKAHRLVPNARPARPVRSIDKVDGKFTNPFKCCGGVHLRREGSWIVCKRCGRRLAEELMREPFAGRRPTGRRRK